MSAYSAIQAQSGRTNWKILDFGRHKEKSLPQVLFTDPDWFFWAMETGVFKTRPSLLRQAIDLAKKAINIKVPQSGPERVLVEHFIDRPTMKYSHFTLVPQSTAAHQGSSTAYRQGKIDLSFPRCVAKNDKKGGRLVVESLKQAYFGSRSARMSREKCEEFFNSPDNFDV